MTPIVFPYTDLDIPQYRLLGSLLGPLTLYQPAEDQVPEALRRWAEQGGVLLRFPLNGREAELKRCMAEYSVWTAQRKGRHGLDSQLLQHQERKVPFLEENAVSRLKSAIRQRAAPQDGAAGQAPESREEGHFQARLLLTMAQAYDRHQQDLARELSRCGQREREMLAALQGEPPGAPGASAAAALPGALYSALYQPGPRLQAWLRLWLADPDRPDSELLVTTDLQSLEGLEAMLPDLTWIQTLAFLPARVSDPVLPGLLLGWLAQLADAPGDPPSWASPPSELNCGPEAQPLKVEVYAALHQPWSRFAPFARPGASPAAADNRCSAGRHGILIRVIAAA